MKHKRCHATTMDDGKAKHETRLQRGGRGLKDEKKEERREKKERKKEVKIEISVLTTKKKPEEKRGQS